MIQEAARKAQEEEEARQRAAAEAARQQEQEQQGGSNITTGGGSSSSGDSIPNTSGSAVVARAQSCLGADYVWGACSPGAFDCSGLVSYCLTGRYVRLGNTTTFMGWPRVSNPQPGDLVCYGSHIGIYIGGGQMIHAPHTGDVVRVANVYGSPWYRRYW